MKRKYLVLAAMIAAVFTGLHFTAANFRYKEKRLDELCRQFSDIMKAADPKDLPSEDSDTAKGIAVDCLDFYKRKSLPWYWRVF